MKFARSLALVLAPLCIPALLLRGDDDTTPDNSSSMLDPDIVPKAFLPKPVVTPEERATKKAAQAKEAASHDWLLRGYQEQMRSRDAKAAAEDEANLYAEISGNADLARRIGISPAELQAMSRREYLRASGNSDDANSSSRHDSGPPSAHITFKPFLPTDDPVAPLPFSLPSPVSTPVTEPLSANTDTSDNEESLQVPGSESERKQDQTAMDIPGMTAAESTPSTRESMGLNTADLLPGETTIEDKPHHALELELPLARDQDRLEKLQNDALKVPGELPKATTNTVVAPAPPPTPESDTAQMVHDPSPIDRHIPDPYDILH